MAHLRFFTAGKTQTKAKKHVMHHCVAIDAHFLPPREGEWVEAAKVLKENPLSFSTH